MPIQDFSTFEEAISFKEGQNNLLAGNGLSIDFDNQIFSYQKLLEAADFGDDAEIIRDIFRNLGTSDFESVAEAINTSRLVAASYGYNEHAERLGQALAMLKEGLIKAVSKNHPLSRYDVSDKRAESLQKFLSHFLYSGGSVFCLNYDLVLYWSVLRKTNLDPKLPYADGFYYISEDQNYVHFAGDNCPKDPNILFPHGTLFFFEQNEEVSKPRGHIFNTPIIDVISTHFEQGKFPLFVSEGRSSQKMKRIRQSHYLNYCYEKIGDCEGTFIIHGHSLDTVSDGHILTKIASNPNITDIYASYFGDENEQERVSLKLQEVAMQARRRGISLGTYPAQSANCWNA